MYEHHHAFNCDVATQVENTTCGLYLAAEKKEIRGCPTLKIMDLVLCRILYSPIWSLLSAAPGNESPLYFPTKRNTRRLSTTTVSYL